MLWRKRRRSRRRRGGRSCGLFPLEKQPLVVSMSMSLVLLHASVAVIGCQSLWNKQWLLRRRS